MIREATPADAEVIAGLVGELGYPTTAEDIARRLEPLFAAGEPPLVAEEGGAVIGCLVWHVTPNLHRAGPVGRTVMLVVAERARGRGLGRALLAEAEARMTRSGCIMAEVTSNIRRQDAHRFYEGAGYDRSSFKFTRDL